MKYRVYRTMVESVDIEADDADDAVEIAQDFDSDWDLNDCQYKVDEL